ncbi:MAG TPA: winged helix DNA-binding domain-containing protein [Candidatus Dormibacteraeota bacterium]|nr:winged helix DNA-binding domain-containing protein [Candidatus Dormibacteraeota bacterium]
MLSAVFGLQAQVLDAAMLGVRARSAGIRRSDILRALNEDRSIVRSWLIRGTLHLVAADDLRWLIDLLGPLFANANRTRQAQLGLDDDLKRRGVDAIRKILAEDGALTRYELVDRLGGRGINLDPRTQAPIHLIQLAALQGVLCLGPDRAGESTYVLIDDWIGRVGSPPRDLALAELARRYFKAYGPATIADLAAWSGIPLALARTAIASARAALVEVAVRGSPAFLLKGRAAESAMPHRRRPTVRLLPAFDTYLLGYRSRDLAVPARLQRRLGRGGGWLHPSVVVDGRAVGAWQLRRSGRRGDVVVEPFAPLSSPIRAGIEGEISDIGRFLQLSLTSAVKW